MTESEKPLLNLINSSGNTPQRPISVLHLCRRFFPQRGGGETYIGALIQELQAEGVKVSVLAAGEPEADYAWNDVPVARADDEALVAATGRSRLLDRFIDLLDTVRPDVVHWHYLPNEAAQLLDACTTRGVRNVQTFLHPVTVCMRHDLVRFGRDICGVRPNAGNCGPCMAHFQGVPLSLATAFTTVANAVPEFIKSRLPQSRLKTSLTLSENVGRWLESQQRSLRRFDKHITISAASVGVLQRSGVDASSIRVSRLGTHHLAPKIADWTDWQVSRRPMRVIFVGRLDVVKGVKTLAEAASLFSADELLLDIFGSAGDAETAVRNLAKMPDSPVRFLGSLADDEVVQRMSEYDFVAIPSRFFETGPFTAVEAMQAGTPILAAHIPSVNEFVNHGKNGWLVNSPTTSDWHEALRTLRDQPDLARQMREGLTYSRCMRDVMLEVLDTYQQVITPARSATTA